MRKILNKDFLNTVFKNVLFFILSKGTAYVAPLLLLKFVDLTDYGIVEYSYSMGGVLAIVASFGLYGSYAYFILKCQENDKIQTFFLYGPYVLVVAITSVFLYHSGIIPLHIQFIILFTLIFSIQRLYSTKLKSEDKGHLGVLVDGGYYFLLLFVVIISYIIKSKQTISMLLFAMEIYLIIWSVFLCLVFYKYKSKKIKEIICKDFPPILKYSFLLIIAGFITFWLTSSARIYIEWFGGYELVGQYSFYFRVAGMAVVIYLFVYIAFFKRLYLAHPRKMDLYYSVILIIVLIGCIGCMFIIPPLSKYLSSTVELDNNKLYILLSLQMPIWVGISLCEGIIGREKLVVKSNYIIGPMVCLFPLVLFLLKSHFSLTLFVFANTIMFFAAHNIQLFLLKSKDIKLKKCWCVNCLLTLSSVLIYFIV